MDLNQNCMTQLPHKVQDEVLKEIIEKNLKSSIDKFNIIYSPGSSKGDNYAGIVFRVQVFEKDKNESKFDLIVKLPPENPTRRSELMLNEFFKKEADFYDNIFPMYKKFQEEKGIDVVKDGFYEVPICYKTITDEPHEGLFFEDLKVLGFELYDRFEELTKDHVSMVMKTLAKMHACFYAIKDQNLELVESYFEMQDFFILLCERPNSPLGAWYDSMKQQAFSVIDKIDDINQLKRLKNVLDKNLYELVTNCFDRKNTEPYAAICHGDCWNNNMMFRNDENGNPKDLRLLDFQIMRYASPVCDLMYYIFGCTSKALRDKHYHEFLNTYYNELSSFIKRLGSDPEKLFPRNAFNDHLQKFGHFGLLMAVMVIPFFTSDPEDAPDMDELTENLRKISNGEEIHQNAFNITSDKTHDRYAERLLGVCEDMFDLGYI